MKMYIKESYVYTLPLERDKENGLTRWVGCNGEACGYERTLDDSNCSVVSTHPLLLKMYKVNGVQICEGCLKDWMENIKEALEEEA